MLFRSAAAGVCDAGREREGGRAGSGREVDRPLAMALAQAVGYLPLALDLAAVQLGDGIPWSELIHDLSAEIARIDILDVVTGDADGDHGRTDSARRQASVRASFNLSLRRLDPLLRARFAWLGVLAEDVEISPAVASVLWETDMRTARDELRILANKSLLMPGRIADGEFRSYRMHDLMGDLARSLLTRLDTTNGAAGAGGHRSLAEAHRELVRRYSSRNAGQPWYALPDDGYIHAHLAWHLNKAGAHDELHALLSTSAPNGSNGWYEARARIGQAAGFLTDVDRAWALARELPGGNSQTNALGLQWRYVLIRASLNSLAMRVPPALLVALVRSRVWSVTEGIAYAAQIPVDHIRSRSLSSLSILLMGAGQADQGLSCALLINEDDVLGAIVCQLLPRLTFNGVQDVLIRASNMKDDFWRTRIFAKSAARLAGLERLDLASEAVHQVEALWGLAEILETVEVQREVPAASFLWKVEARANELGGESPGGRLTAALVRAYAVTGQAESSERLVRALRDEGSIALASLGAVRSGGSKASLIADQCVQKLNEIANHSRHLEATAEAVTYLAESLNRCIGRRTLTALARVHDDWQRVLWLRTFAPFLLDDVMEGAVSAALSCRDDDARREALEVLMPHVNRQLAESLVHATSQLESAPEQIRRFCALLNSDADTSFQWHQVFLQLEKLSDPEAVADDLARLVGRADGADRLRLLAAIALRPPLPNAVESAHRWA